MYAYTYIHIYAPGHDDVAYSKKDPPAGSLSEISRGDPQLFCKMDLSVMHKRMRCPFVGGTSKNRSTRTWRILSVSRIELWM